MCLATRRPFVHVLILGGLVDGQSEVPTSSIVTCERTRESSCPFDIDW